METGAVNLWTKLNHWKWQSTNLS